jgi:hypothetical protein
LPGSRLPTTVGAIERPCAVDRRGDERLLERHPIAKQARVIANGIDGEKPPPGLTSVRKRDRDACGHQIAGGREATELEIEGGVWQQRGGDAASPPAPRCH